MERKREKKSKAIDIAQCAVFVALMVAGTYISIPFWPVPLTFQTVICVLSGLLLGWKKGMISMGIYMLMGLIGIPVFSGGGSGFWYVTRPTFGYIIGFIAAAGVSGAVRGSVEGASLGRYIAAAVIAFLANYAVGIPYFAAVWIMEGNADITGAILMYNILYMPKDLALSVLAAMVAKRVLPLVRRGRNKIRDKRAKKKTKGKNTEDIADPLDGGDGI